MSFFIGFSGGVRGLLWFCSLLCCFRDFSEYSAELLRLLVRVLLLVLLLLLLVVLLLGLLLCVFLFFPDRASELLPDLVLYFSVFLPSEESAELLLDLVLRLSAFFFSDESPELRLSLLPG